MVTRTQIDHANPQTVLGIVNSWKNYAKDLLSRADTYRQTVTLPGGQPWSGATRDAAVAMAGNDYTAIDHMCQAIDAMSDTAANGINFTVIPNLNAVRNKITEAENNGFHVNDDLSVTDTRQHSGDTPDPVRTQDRDNYERDIKALAQKWWDADQAVADQINKDKQGLAANFSGGHIAESPDQAEADVRAALSGNQSAATRVNAILDSITPDQLAGKVPLTPAQASVLSQLQAQEHGMSKDALNATEKKLGDQSDDPEFVAADEQRKSPLPEDSADRRRQGGGGHDDRRVRATAQQHPAGAEVATGWRGTIQSAVVVVFGVGLGAHVCHGRENRCQRCREPGVPLLPGLGSGQGGSRHVEVVREPQDR